MNQYTINFEQKMKPNLLNFANNILLSSDKRGAYSIHTGEQNPDTGFFITLVEETRPGVDKDTLREFYLEHADLLVNPNMWLGVWWDGDKWMYAVAELVYDLEVAVIKGISRGTDFVYNNANGDYIELVQPQGKGTHTQVATYARIEADKIIEKYLSGAH